jgi:hypothetical protein
MSFGLENVIRPSTVSILIAKADNPRKCFELWTISEKKAEYAKTIIQ